MRKALRQLKPGPQRLKSRNGQIYEVQPAGNYLRISPQRPWRGKSERRQVIRQRRANRAAVLAARTELGDGSSIKC